MHLVTKQTRREREHAPLTTQISKAVFEVVLAAGRCQEWGQAVSSTTRCNVVTFEKKISVQIIAIFGRIDQDLDQSPSADT